ncbi:hypothetical protein ABE79_10770, partial [Proteus mirabilis]
APTQGLFAHDPRLVDNYSGPASSFWSLRAVIIALYCADRINLWQTPSLPLPIEKDNFRFEIPAIQALVTGVKATQEVNVIFLRRLYHSANAINPPFRKTDLSTKSR